MATMVTENKRNNRRSGLAETTRPATRPSLVPNHTTPATDRSQIVILPHPRKAPGGLRSLPRTGEPLPMGQRGSRPARAVKNLSLRSPMLVATLFASFAVSLLCLYVTAYAQVSAEARNLSHLRQDLKSAERREIELKGEISRLTLSAQSRAQAIGLVPAPPETVQVLSEEQPSGSAPKKE